MFLRIKKKSEAVFTFLYLISWIFTLDSDWPLDMSGVYAGKSHNPEISSVIRSH